MGPLHPVTWRLALICSSSFTAAFIFRLPCCFLVGSARDFQQPGPLPQGPPRESRCQPITQRRTGRSPLLNEADQEMETVPLSLPWP